MARVVYYNMKSLEDIVKEYLSDDENYSLANGERFTEGVVEEYGSEKKIGKCFLSNDNKNAGYDYQVEDFMSVADALAKLLRERMKGVS